MSNLKAIILRGLPGSGKTTLFHQYYGELEPGSVVHCSADSFFYVPVEEPMIEPHYYEYSFNPALLPQAHTVCMGVFLEAVKSRRPYVVLDNTCSQLWEYRNYVAMAEAFGYDVRILSLPIPKSIEEAKVIFDRQKHGVPLDIFLKMWWRWEPDSREEIVEAEDPGHE